MPEPMTAHARLIAAASDLVEALQVARVYVEKCAQRDGWINRPDTDLTAIDAALAKGIREVRGAM